MDSLLKSTIKRDNLLISLQWTASIAEKAEIYGNMITYTRSWYQKKY